MHPILQAQKVRLNATTGEMAPPTGRAFAGRRDPARRLTDGLGWGATVIAMLSVVQLYVPGPGNAGVSLFVLGALAFAMARLARVRTLDATLAIVASILGIKLAYALRSNLFAGLRDIIFTMPFVGYFVVAYLARDTRTIERAAWLTVLVGVVQSGAVVLFRLAPALEAKFWGSVVARVTIGPNALAAFLNGTAPNNVSDPDKAGGLILNANVAGACALVMTFLTLALATRRHPRLGYVLALIHVAAVLACGSKASLIILAGTLLLAMLATIGSQLRKPATLKVPLALVLGAPILAIAVSYVIMNPPNLSMFSHDSVATIQSREIMWRVGVSYFKQHPLAGLGYGGWEERRMHDVPGLAVLRLPELMFPPHNAFLFLWSTNGLLGVLATLSLYGQVLFRGARNERLPSGERRWLICAILAAFAQAQGENFPVFGDVHFSALMGMIMGLLLNGTYAGDASRAGRRIKDDRSTEVALPADA